MMNAFGSVGMRRALIFALSFATAPASAATAWSSPGWYLIADAQVREWIEKGPFKSDGDCSALLPRLADSAHGTIAYSCEFLKNAPMWD
jgi:hypothetical protein